MYGMYGMNETIDWDVDQEGKKTGTGRLKTPLMSGPCYDRKIGVGYEASSFINLMINIPQWNLRENKDDYISFVLGLFGLFQIDPLSELRLHYPF